MKAVVKPSQAGIGFTSGDHLPRPNRTMIYLCACVFADLRLARGKQVNTRASPTIAAITESVDLAHEIFNSSVS